MSRRRARSVVATALAVLVAALALVGSATAADGVSITVDPNRIATELGGTFGFRTVITNRSATETPALVAHLDVLSLRNGVYVDPEDWSSKRTWYIAPIPAGGSRTIAWELQAVNTGRFAAYVAVMPQRDPRNPPLTSPVVQVAVAERRTINSGGILPLVIGIPCLVGVLAGAAHIARRR